MIRRLIPYSAKVAAKKVIFYGTHRRCPACRSKVRVFKSAGSPLRGDARCPVCGALERVRLLWVFLARHTNLLDGKPKRMLHIAPELIIEQRLREHAGIDYLTADLMSPRAMVKMDIMDIQFPDASFDVIHNSHVLEHVLDDRRAMAELSRVLRPGGWMTVQVPITQEKTIEDPSITDAAERLRRFGQHDHVRSYGPDVVDRIREAGLDVDEVLALDILTDADAERFAIPANESIFYCRRSDRENLLAGGLNYKSNAKPSVK